MTLINRIKCLFVLVFKDIFSDSQQISPLLIDRIADAAEKISRFSILLLMCSFCAMLLRFPDCCGWEVLSHQISLSIFHS
ncbi:CLUMA_CG013161, isoform A [Clunio marinus]|uniref:CLUMA_CG013161, isoform A n=1 Tax=Clunio marinus TaxID=568069 RepID=A0A1J1IJB7_9DIPT|nr:CLUMA_CG013161, isoform A [Clunio marinus]